MYSTSIIINKLCSGTVLLQHEISCTYIEPGPVQLQLFALYSYRLALFTVSWNYQNTTKLKLVINEHFIVITLMYAWKYCRVKCVERDTQSLCVERDTQSLCVERDTPGFFFIKRPIEGYINKMYIFSWFCAVVHIIISRIADRNCRSFHVMRR